MGRYVFNLAIEGESDKVSLEYPETFDGKQTPVSPGLSVYLDDVGGLYCEGVLLRDQEWVTLKDSTGEERKVYLYVRQVLDKAQDDPSRLKGKVCHDCRLWNRTEGKKQYSLQTHKYGNGSFSRIEEIIGAVASHNRTQPLTLEDVGYCPIHTKLCSERSIACEQYQAKPPLVRLRNWWKRLFS